MDTSKNAFQLLGQGTYGCVYRPAFHKKTMKPLSANKVSKIQVKNALTEKEIALGKLIKQQIPNYFFFFGPIIDSFQVSKTKLDAREFDQCAVAEKHPNEIFVSNKINYIGKKTLGIYFEEKIQNIRNYNQLKDFFISFVDSHVYLLKSCELLNNAHVIHMDLKENNVMFHEKKRVFIIIDFGLSVNSKMLDITTYITDSKHPFGIMTEAYIPWNLDIIILSYLAREVQPRNKDGTYQSIDPTKFDSKLDINSLKTIINKFIANNPLLKEKALFQEKEINAFKTEYFAFVDSYRNKPIRQLWVELVRHKKSWDCYSIQVMYLRLLHSYGMTSFLEVNTKPTKKPSNLPNIIPQNIRQAFTDSNEQLESLHFFKQYIVYLKTCILSSPANRPTALESYKKIVSLFEAVPKTNFLLFEDYMKNNITNSKNTKRLVKNRKDHTLIEIQQEADLMEKHEQLIAQ